MSDLGFRVEDFSISVLIAGCISKLNANLELLSSVLDRGEMSKKKNPLVFLDVSIDGDPAERIFIEVMHFLNLLYW